MAFVAAAANLRASIFSCTPRTVSLFKAKEMAGNIIPAIATTNSIAAALVTLNAINVMRNHCGSVANVYITHGAPKRLLTRENLEPGTEECPVCNTTRFKLLCDPETNLGRVIGVVGVEYEEVSILLNGRLLYDSVDMAESVLSKSLSAFSVAVGDILTINMDDRRPILLGIFDGDGELEVSKVHSATESMARPAEPEALSNKRAMDDEESESKQSSKVIKIDDSDDLVILE